MTEETTGDFGANLGAELDEALVTQGIGLQVAETPVPPPARQPRAERPRRERAPAREPYAPQPANPHALHLVGLQLGDAGGSQLFSPFRHLYGTVIMGPEAALAGVLSEAVFKAQLRLERIQLYAFDLHPQSKHLTRGSLVYNPAGKYCCPQCGLEKMLDDAKVQSIRRMEHRNGLYCAICEAAGHKGTRMIWRRLPPVRLNPDDPRATTMWQMFQNCAMTPPAESNHMLPRIWGTYGVGTAPDETWRPAADDVRAQALERKEAEVDLVIRPYSIAEKAQSRALVSLAMEKTLDPATGQPGMTFGWLAEDTLGGATVRNPEYGFLIRVVPKVHQQSGQRHPRNR